MKKNYHFSRKYRQLKYAVKQLKNSPNDVRLSKSLILKIKRLINQLKSVMPAFRLKRLVAPALLILGTSVQNPVASQEFGEPLRNPFGIVTNIPVYTSPLLVDLDADGDLDLFTVSYGRYYTGDFYYQENLGSNSQPNFGDVVGNPFGLQTNQGGLFPTFGDIDGDGDLDLMFGSYEEGLSFYENTGTLNKPKFEIEEKNPFNINTDNYADFIFPEFTDFDKDGDLDIFATDVYGDYLYFQNSGNKTSPNFDLPIANPFGLNSFEDRVNFVRTADFDNDGDLDLVVGAQSYPLDTLMAYFDI